MGSRAMIISKVAFQYTAQMPFAQHNHMIETFTPDRPDQPLHIWALPRTMWRGNHFFNLHPFHSATKLFAIYLIAIPQEEARGALFRKRLNDLLRGPGGRRMFGHIEVNDTPAIVRQYN